MNKQQAQLHESFVRDEVIAGPSDRSFGLVFAGAFAIIAGLSAWHGGSLWPYWLAGAAVFAMIALVRAQLLNPLNRLWLRFGLLLQKIVTPVIIGLIFVCLFAPIGLVLRALGKDLLRIRKSSAQPTYWIEREPAGPEPGTMADQF